jgi:predicted kinase
MSGPLLVAMMGRTGAGKSTLSQVLATGLPAWRISEVAIKRALRSGLSAEDAYDETLRDLGYRAAIAAAQAALGAGLSCIVDASFHRRVRRDWVAAASGGVIWVYCRCDDEQEVARRIAVRPLDGPDGHARSMEIYQHIAAAFEEPEEFVEGERAALIHVDTLVGRVWSAAPHASSDPALRNGARRVESLVTAYCQVLVEQRSPLNKG